MKEGGVPLQSTHVGDPLIEPLLAEFIRDLPAQLAELAGAAEAQNLAATRRLAHRLSGDAATYGLPELASVAFDLERAAGSGLTEALSLGQLVGSLMITGQRVLDGHTPRPTRTALGL